MAVPSRAQRTIRSILRALLAVTLALPRCVAAAPDAAALHALAQRIDSERTRLGIPALAVTLTSADRVLWSAVYGVADLSTGRTADSNTLFRIGSVTKMFTAAALLIAQEDGALQLDARATDIAPDFPMHNPWQDTHPVRVEQLLENSAGLPDLSREEFDRNVPMELGAALAWKAADRRALWPPGLHSSYSNVGAGLAAFLLERATGRRYEDFVRDRIFEPLGMKSAGFFPDPETMAHLATGYDSDGSTAIPYWHMLYRAFGAINVRPSEMAPFMEMLLNRGEYAGRHILSPASIDRMETPRTTLGARAGLRFGYGLGNYTWLHHGVLFHGHGGDADGYLARLGYSRERGLGYFIVINVFRESDLERIRSLIEDFIAGDSRPEPPPPGAASPDRLAAYAGDYREVTARFPDPGNAYGQPGELHVEVDGSSLKLSSRDSTWHLIPVTVNAFRRRSETVATSIFVEYEGGMYFQDASGNYVKTGTGDTGPR